MMHLAMHDALNAIVPVYAAVCATPDRSSLAHPVAAAAQAAHDVLVSQYPDQQLTPRRRASAEWLAQVPDGALRDARNRSRPSRGCSAILARARGRRLGLPRHLRVPRPAPGQYQTTPPWNGFVAQPGFRLARPFALDVPGSVPAAAPAAAEEQGVRDARFDEVKEYGAVDSSSSHATTRPLTRSGGWSSLKDR